MYPASLWYLLDVVSTGVTLVMSLLRGYSYHGSRTSKVLSHYRTARGRGSPGRQKPAISAGSIVTRHTYAP